MINEIFLMNGYGLYVWSAFAFTLLSFVSLYLITRIQYVKEKNKFISKFGNLNSKRDFTFVSDTVDGFISTIGNKKCIGETIQLGTGIDFSMKQTLNEIKKITKTKIKFVQDKERMRPKKSEVNRLISLNKKAKKILKWSPKYSGKDGFNKGLKETVEWFSNKENLSKYKSNLYNF